MEITTEELIDMLNSEEKLIISIELLKNREEKCRN